MHYVFIHLNSGCQYLMKIIDFYWSRLFKSSESSLKNVVPTKYCSKPVCNSFFCGTQKAIFWMWGLKGTWLWYKKEMGKKKNMSMHCILSYSDNLLGSLTKLLWWKYYEVGGKTIFQCFYKWMQSFSGKTQYFCERTIIFSPVSCFQHDHVTLGSLKTFIVFIQKNWHLSLI